MRCILWTILLARCAVGAYAAQHRPTHVLNYTFEPVVNDGKLVLHVLLEFKGGPVKTESLVLPSTWGSAKHLERGILNLRNIHQAGVVRVSYDLVRDWAIPPPRTDHHALLEPEYFEFTTQNALVHPPIDTSAPVEAHFDWRKLPPEWSLVTSFGTGNRVQSYRGRWDGVRNALFAGGDFRIHRRSVAGRPLILAIRGAWQFTDEEAAAQIEKLIAFERAFWHDRDFPYYLVTVSTFGREDGGAGGGGFTNAFAVFLPRKSSFGYSIRSLLAHEIFHTWNPYRMGVASDPSIDMSWFTEGFTTYYQDVLMLRSGLLALPEYVRVTNESLRKYLLSPDRNASNAEIVVRHLSDSPLDDLLYARGAITALWLDWTIREASGGKSSLDTFMFDLVRQGRRQKPALTAERVFQTAGKFIGAAPLQQLREYAELGKTIQVPAAALGACVTLQMDDIPAFELGIDREALLSQHVVSGVKPGSAAALAGLREGQHVTSTSIYWNDVSKRVKLTVSTEAGSEKIEYYPRGPSPGPVPQYHVIGGASIDDVSCLPANAHESHMHRY